MRLILEGTIKMNTEQWIYRDTRGKQKASIHPSILPSIHILPMVLLWCMDLCMYVCTLYIQCIHSLLSSVYPILISQKHNPIKNSHPSKLSPNQDPRSWTQAAKPQALKRVSRLLGNKRSSTLSFSLASAQPSTKDPMWCFWSFDSLETTHVWYME